MSGIPCIKELNGIKTLFVDDEPFLILGGESHNSSASNLDYMEQKVWSCIQDLNMNTLVTPVSWELLEPEEGKFDFQLVDGIIDQARTHKMHLVILWFGLWKNAESNYVPGWVRTNPEIYHYIEQPSGEKMNIISPLCNDAVDKDAKALRNLMAHIREYDGSQHTVLMVQVENELGVLGGGRDYSETASLQFNQEVPEEIQNLFNVSGIWSESFGADAEEQFMAYYYAKAVEKIAAAGKEEYPIPYYTNAWLEQFPWTCGSYPTGGPIAKNHKMWKAVAPTLCCLAPDIYVGYVPQVMEEYAQTDNPLFIPEVRKDAATASYCLYAFAKYNTLGYSPFAIEEFGWPPEEVEIPPMEWLIALNIDPSAFQMEGAKEALSSAYALMQSIKPLYLKYRGTDKLQAFVKKGEYNYGELLHFEEVDVKISHGPKTQGCPVSGGMIIEADRNCFYIIGMMGKVEFLPKTCDGTKVEVLKHEEGKFVQGKWLPGRRLNGDERMPVQLNKLAGIHYVEIYLA